MAKIKRWFPVTHDINGDPEVVDLTDKFGLSGLKVWLEILSVADRNNGQFGTDWEAIKRALSIKCNTTQRHVSGILELIQSRSWITCELPASVVKYSEYHKTREPNKTPSEPSLPSEPSEPKNPNTGTPAVVDISPQKRRELDQRIKEPADRIYKSDRKKFDRLIAWIKQAQRYKYSDEVIGLTLVAFERYVPVVQDWWPYLDRIIDKMEKDVNARQAQKDHERFKEELKETYAEAQRRS